MSEAAVTVEPLRKKIVVPLSPEEAFLLFTDGMATWWPLTTHSVAQEHAVSCRFEPLAGGRIFEIDDQGTEVEWGRVLVFEPPRRLVCTWYPGRGPQTAQQLEIVFEAESGGTAVSLEHRGWATLAEDALELRSNYDRGWDSVLGRFVASVTTSSS
jgi:uncharacterized protein YndB with AHSA1/START domain